MKAIKIVPENAAKIEAELARVNGKSTRHAFTSFEEIRDEAAHAERKLAALGLSGRATVGAVYAAQSGGAVAKAYKSARNVTRVALERKGPGWYLVDAFGTAVYPDQPGYGRLHLTTEQDARVIANVRKAYEVKA